MLLEAGRHLKRGLLLYGPPGTGKTLSVMYLCNRMPGADHVLLGGPGVAGLGQAAAIARAPAAGDGRDRGRRPRRHRAHDAGHGGHNPLLFQLLNEMDGLAEDADVIFVLTTNRVELLEPALAARPGRIDQAVEIKLPDAECRRRLFDRYLQGVTHQSSRPSTASSPGPKASSPAFIRELVRRATLAAVEPAGRPCYGRPPPWSADRPPRAQRADRADDPRRRLRPGPRHELRRGVLVLAVS